MANFDQDIWNWFMSRVYDRSKIEIEKFDFETAFLSKMTYFVKRVHDRSKIEIENFDFESFFQVSYLWDAD